MKNKTQSWGEKGNFALMSAFILALMVGFFALVVDVGFLQWTGNREEDIAESAALAAVKELDQTDLGLNRAREIAANVVSASDPNNEFMFNKNSDVVFGTWDGKQFTTNNQTKNINAVKINVEKNKSKGNPIRPLVAGVLGLFDKNLPSNIDLNEFAIAATATNGIPNNANIFPLAVNSCDLSQSGLSYSLNNSLACGREIVFGDNPEVVQTECSCHCFDIIISPSFTRNPSNARIVDLSLTSGNNNSINSVSFNKMLNDLVACKQKNDTPACTRIQANLGNNISVTSDKNILSSNSSITNFNSLLGSNGLNVQVPVMNDNCSQSNINNNIVSPQIPSYSYYAAAVSSPNNKQIIGFATLNISEISTGNKKYIRAEVVCDQKISGVASQNSNNISFGTLVKNQGRLVRNPTNLSNNDLVSLPKINDPILNPQLPSLPAASPIYTPPAWGCY